MIKKGDFMRLQDGQKAPAFKLLDQNAKEISSKDLEGRKYILYFYPKDNTKGCSLEARDFTQNLENFAKKGYEIYGVSPDNAKSHVDFIKKQALGFSLLCDEDKKIASKYAAFGKKMLYGKEHIGIIRSTFLIDEKGVIIKTYYNVRATGHVARVLKDLK